MMVPEYGVPSSSTILSAMIAANQIKPPLKSRNHTSSQFIGETFNHSYCRSEEPKKSRALYFH